MDPTSVAHALRRGLPVTDQEFDTLLQDDVRSSSKRFWTPVAVARLAATWLYEVGVKSVLDVGSGPGKFCVVGALSTPLTFTGIEHRSYLHAASVGLAIRCGVRARASFVLGDLSTVRFEDFDALYLFNPFGENLFGEEEQLDQMVDLGEQRFAEDVAAVEAAMNRMPPGTRVATYHGFGGCMPDSYILERCENAGTDVVRLWKKGVHEDSVDGDGSGSGQAGRLSHIRPLGGAPAA